MVRTKEGWWSKLLDFKDLLVVVCFFSFSFENAMSSFWYGWLFVKGLKPWLQKMHDALLAINLTHGHPNELHQRSLALLIKTLPVKVWRCDLTSTSWNTFLRRDANRSYILSCFLWINLLSYTTLHDQHQISCHNDM